MALGDNAGEKLGAELQNGFDPLPQGNCYSACRSLLLPPMENMHSFMNAFVVIQHILKCVGILASNIIYF